MPTTDASRAGSAGGPPRERSPANLAPRTWATAAGILAVGWSVAVVVYLTAAPVVEDDLVDDWEHSKKYLMQLERLGGKAAVLGSEMNQWFAGLWQGRNLAYTIAFAAAAAAAAYLAWAFRAARCSGEPGPPG